MRVIDSLTYGYHLTMTITVLLSLICTPHKDGTLMVIVLGTYFGNYTVSPYYCIYIQREHLLRFINTDGRDFHLS